MLNHIRHVLSYSVANAKSNWRVCHTVSQTQRFVVCFDALLVICLRSRFAILQTTLLLLEAKLRSIPGIDAFGAAPSVESQPAQQLEQQQAPLATDLPSVQGPLAIEGPATPTVEVSGINRRQFI